MASFRPAEHVRKRAEFERIYQTGFKRHGRLMTLFTKEREDGVARLGIAATRKMGGAVERNRAKRVVREVCSEASLRASAGPAAETPPLSPVLERLSRVIDAGITDQERQILRWISAAMTSCHSMVSRRDARSDTFASARARSSPGT